MVKLFDMRQDSFDGGSDRYHHELELKYALCLSITQTHLHGYTNLSFRNNGDSLNVTCTECVFKKFASG